MPKKTPDSVTDFISNCIQTLNGYDIHTYMPQDTIEFPLDVMFSDQIEDCLINVYKRRIY